MKNVQNNLYNLFERNFPEDRHKPLLISGDNRYTCSYAQADIESSRLAAFLLAQGLSSGDRVTVQVEKSPQALWLYLACLRAGLVYHPLNTAYQRSELSYFVENAEPAVIVCDQKNASLFTELAANSQVKKVLTLGADGQGSLYEACDKAGFHPGTVEFETAAVAEDDTAALLYSSGTTGKPKGIMLSHGNLSANAQVLTDTWGFVSDDVLLHALPVFHVHGLFVALGCVLASGASMIWLSEFNAEKILANLDRCSVMMGVPTYYSRLLADDRLTRERVEGMRLFVSGSAPLLKETFVTFESRTGHAILERYGMTETNMNTSNPLKGERRPGTVGLPLPGTRLRVVDASGEILPEGETGNIQVKGPNVFSGYWRMPEKTAADFTEDGYFNTGDLGFIDSQGYLSIAGRSKDMIISGGLNVYPKEIELIIDEIDGVLESAVIGVPHSDFGEGVVAVVVPDHPQFATQFSEQHIIETVKSEMAGYKVPKSVVFLDELPRNTMGKVQKNILREQYSDVLR